MIAEKRREDGLCALSLQWGLVDHAGIVDAKIKVLYLSIGTSIRLINARISLLS